VSASARLNGLVLLGATSEQPVVVRVQDGGFHWLDAAVGAAIVLAAGLLAMALVLEIRNRS